MDVSKETTLLLRLYYYYYYVLLPTTYYLLSYCSLLLLLLQRRTTFKVLNSLTLRHFVSNRPSSSRSLKGYLSWYFMIINNVYHIGFGSELQLPERKKWEE